DAHDGPIAFAHAVRAHFDATRVGPRGRQATRAATTPTLAAFGELLANAAAVEPVHVVVRAALARVRLAAGSDGRGRSTRRRGRCSRRRRSPTPCSFERQLGRLGARVELTARIPLP